MRKFKLLILCLLICLLTQAQSRRVRVEAGAVGFGLIAGGSFIVAGLAQQPDEKWVKDPKGLFYNNGEIGNWRRETFWEDRNRVLAVASGLFIFGASITIHF